MKPDGDVISCHRRIVLLFEARKFSLARHAGEAQRARERGKQATRGRAGVIRRTPWSTACMSVTRLAGPTYSVSSKYKTRGVAGEREMLFLVRELENLLAPRPTSTPCAGTPARYAEARPPRRSARGPCRWRPCSAKSQRRRSPRRWRIQSRRRERKARRSGGGETSGWRRGG